MAHDKETMRRMWELTTEKRRAELEKATPEETEARNRMALFPIAKGGHGGDGQGGSRSEVLFVSPERWVPVLRLGGKVSHPLRARAERRLCSCVSSQVFRASFNSCS